MRPVTLISNPILNTGRIITPSATKALRAPLRIQSSYLKNLPQLTISHLVTVEAIPQNLKKLEDYIENNINSLDPFSLQFLFHNILQMLAADTKDLTWITPSVAHHILKVSNNILNKVEFYANHPEEKVSPVITQTLLQFQDLSFDIQTRERILLSFYSDINDMAKQASLK